MNRIYKTLFSIRTDQLVIASENKSNHRKVTVGGCKPEPPKIPSLHFQPHHDGTRAGLVRTVSKLSIATAVACAISWSGAAWATASGGTAPTSGVCQQDAVGDLACEYNSTASGEPSVAIGDGSIAIGSKQAEASGYVSTAIGGFSTASGNGDIAVGGGGHNY